jgi:hypothetical protein
LPSPPELTSRKASFTLAAMVALAAAVWSFFAVKHTAARFFPDEYTYASLGRSIGEGHYAIRGATAHFPAFLEPLLTAPAWALFSTTTAYHLIQVENVILMSLACVPAYLLARYLRLSRGYALVCGVYAVAIPSFLFASFTLSDPVGYPFALAAVASGVRALDRPTIRRQALFLAFAGLATFARVQYLAVPAAYVVAAALLDRRRFPRAHWLVLAPIAPAFLAVLAVGPSRALGLYSDNPVFKLNFGVLHTVGHWFLVHLFLLTLSTGVIVVPGAVAGLVRPRGRAERAFAFMAAALAFLLILQASSYSATGIERFRGRYVFLLLPLVPIAFGLYLKRGRPHRPLVIAIAVIVALAVARLPLSGYTGPVLSDDSPFLFAVTFVQLKLGITLSSLLVAALATLGAAAAVAVALVGRGFAAAIVTVGIAVVVSAGAVANDLDTTSTLRSQLPHRLTWVDDASPGRLVTAVLTPGGAPGDLFEPLYWNRSVQRELLLGNAYSGDTWRSAPAPVTAEGRLLGAQGNLLFDVVGTTVRLADARLLARERGFALWQPNGAARLRLLIEGRYFDEWLGGSGRIRAWPLRPGDATRLSFTLLVPANQGKPRIHLTIGRSHLTVERGVPQKVVCVSGGRPLDLAFSSSDVFRDPNLRLLSLKLLDARVDDVPRVRAASHGGACSVDA